MIHDKIWSSRNNLQLTLRQRLLFIGLFTCADDQGRVDGHPGLIRSEIFKFDEFTTEEIAADLDAIEATSAIIKYSQDGMENIQLTAWWDHQKLQWAQPSDFPAPDGWQDRIRYQHKGEILTYNWSSPAGDESEDTCDATGQPLASEPAREQGGSPPSDLPSNPPSDPPKGISIKDKSIKDLNTLGDESPSPSDGGLTGKEKKAMQGKLEDHFSEKTKLRKPKRETKPERDAAGKLWWTPLWNLLELVDWNWGDAKRLVDETIIRMDGITLSHPKGAVNTANAIHAEWARKGNGTNGRIVITDTSPIAGGR